MFPNSHVLLLVITLFFQTGFHLVTASSAPPKPLKRVAHPSTLAIEILPRQRSLSGSYGKRSFPVDSPILRHSDSFRLKLSAFDETFYLHLRPNEHLVHPAARINYYKTTADGHTVLSHTKPLLRESVKAYWGEVIPADSSSGRLREDAAGVLPRPSGKSELGWARIMVHHQGDAAAGIAPVFEGAFSVNGVIHHVMTKDNYVRNKHHLDPHIALADDDPDSLLVIWRDSDVMNTHEYAAALSGGLDINLDAPTPHTCGHDRLTFNTDPHRNTALRKPVVPPTTPWYDPFGLFDNSTLVKRDDVAGGGMGSNFQDYIGQSAGCPSTQKILYIGVAADCEYTTQYGSQDNATQQIINNLNTAGALYKSTFNVSLGIVELQVHDPTCPSTADSTAPWNLACSTNVTLNDRLSIFSGWRGQKGNDGAGLWHLMSGCPTGTEVGIAWLATLCDQSSSGSAPAIVSGTAVSTAGRTEWLVVSHEIGHNFGAIHDCTDGCASDDSQCCPLSLSSCDANSKYIMSPVAESGEMNFSPCSLGNICSLMQGSTGGSTNTSCLADASAARETITLQMCGNGIVEAGEDCDPGLGSNSTCCDVSTCKFLGNAVCDPDSSPCCTAQCSFAPATQVCRPSKDASCDIAEMCTGNSSACPADVIVPNGRSCGSNGLACASGTCTSLDAQCQLVGASMNLQKACANTNDKSCQVSCQDPSNSNQCVVLQSTLIDGSPCGYGGTCYSGSCKAGSVLATIKAWYADNLQISIPVTIVAGVVILLLIYILVTCLCRPSRSKRRRAAARAVEPALARVRSKRIPSWPNGDGQPTGFNSAAMVQPRQANPVVSLANVPPQSPGGYAATHSRGHSTPTVGRDRRSGGSNHRASKSGSHYAPQFPVEPVRNSRSHWVDESLYNGPPALG